MRTVNVGAVSSSLGNLPQYKTLTQIVEEYTSTRGAMNPYTLVAQKIMTNLNKFFVFPFYQPQVVNPFEFDEEQPYYVNGNNQRFVRAQFREARGMQEPEDMKLCIDNQDRPYFVSKDELSTKPGYIDYQVFNKTSFSDFIARLSRDISFLRPVDRSELSRTDSQHQFSPGDIVLVPGQVYGKLAVVREVGRKEYTAKLYTAEGIHNSRIGVNQIDVLPYGIWQSEDSDFEELIEQLDISWNNSEFYGRSTKEWAKQVAAGKIGRFPIGSGFVLAGNPELDDDTGVGYVTIVGWGEKTATVVPHTFNSKETRPWGTVGSLSIPFSGLIPLGSLDELKSGGDIYDRFFADDAVVMSIVREVTEKEIENPHVQGVITYTDIMRYKRLHDDLAMCPQLSPKLVAPQFIKLVTQSGMGGIERLAEVSHREISDIAQELLSFDYNEAVRTIERDGKKYSEFIERLDKITRETTPFNLFRDLLIEVGPKSGIYQVQRDGGFSLAYIDNIQTYTNLDFESAQDFFIRLSAMQTRRQNTMLEYSKREFSAFEAPFACANKLLESQFFFDDSGYVNIFGINYHILSCENTVRYGWNDKQQMTYPSVMNIDNQLQLHPLESEFQVKFINEILQQIYNSANFIGKGQFFKALNTGKPKRNRDEEDYDHYSRRSVSAHLLEDIRPLYNGIHGLSNDPKVRDRIAKCLLESRPLLREAYYAYADLQRLIMVRDHYFRGNVPEKQEYLDKYGYPHKIPHSGFADEFYNALAWVDQYHRGFPYEESEIQQITRQGYNAFSMDDGQTTLGLIESPHADQLLTSILDTMLKLTSRNSPQDVPLLHK